MTDATEQKIMDIALKVFAEEGYVGARTRIIAEKSGFSEMTLFRKFKTKENLFKMVLVTNQERILGDIDSIFKNNEFKSPEESFRVLIKHILELIEDNFELVSIFLNERRKVSGDTIEVFMNRLIQYIEEIFPDNNVDTKVFAFNILSFLYFIVYDGKQGYTFTNHEEAVEEFIDYNMGCLQS